MNRIHRKSHPVELRRPVKVDNSRCFRKQKPRTIKDSDEKYGIIVEHDIIIHPKKMRFCHSDFIGSNELIRLCSKKGELVGEYLSVNKIAAKTLKMWISSIRSPDLVYCYHVPHIRNERLFLDDNRPFKSIRPTIWGLRYLPLPDLEFMLQKVNMNDWNFECGVPHPIEEHWTSHAAKTIDIDGSLLIELLNHHTVKVNFGDHVPEDNRLLMKLLFETKYSNVPNIWRMLHEKDFTMNSIEVIGSPEFDPIHKFFGKAAIRLITIISGLRFMTLEAFDKAYQHLFSNIHHDTSKFLITIFKYFDCDDFKVIRDNLATPNLQTWVIQFGLYSSKKYSVSPLIYLALSKQGLSQLEKIEKEGEMLCADSQTSSMVKEISILLENFIESMFKRVE